MTDERITETRDELGNTHTTHTIVRDDAPRQGGGSTLLILLVGVVLAVGAFILFSQMSGAEVAKDIAVAEAAGEVGDAAGQVGDAAQNAGNAVRESVPDQ